jgi:DNA-binding transcriptional regulator YdaS (Cro superfamily)
MDLPSYIRSLDPQDTEAAIARAAQQFGVSPRAVKGWLYGERRPRPDDATRIVECTKGKVTLTAIYGASQQ